ncbi:hypothetical protein [Longimicrobium sp.]|uniref:hypothetical protein n=1 Tax=Longimicrobium sp. TaxID=2029185 RepID=UPI002ED91E9D
MTTAARRTWQHRGGQDWRPLFITRLDCGCWIDSMATPVRMWEPCMAHEADGHLAAISDDDGMTVARCLVRDCKWTVREFYESVAVRAAQDHWQDTRAS